MKLAVVVATYNRPEGLARLLEDLCTQQLPAADFEVVVVDDGSSPPVRPRAEALSVPYALTLIEQPNAGQAAARDTGIQAARAEVLVIVDDDMRVGPEFLKAHLALHDAGT